MLFSPWAHPNCLFGVEPTACPEGARPMSHWFVLVVGFGVHIQKNAARTCDADNGAARRKAPLCDTEGTGKVVFFLTFF